MNARAKDTACKPCALILAWRQSHAMSRDVFAEAAIEAAMLANTAPAHAREFWRRLAGSLRKAETVPR